MTRTRTTTLNSGMKTIDVRLLVTADVDVQELVNQLVRATTGPGSPRGAVVVELGGYGDEYEVVPDEDYAVVTTPSEVWWSGNRIDPSDSTPPRPLTSVERVQKLARELYPRD